MSEVLDKIDLNLRKIEDRVLREFVKIQELESADGHGELNDALKLQIRDALGKLRYRLDHSGSGHLELTTDLHEVLRARLFVLDGLLDKRVPTVCMQDLDRPGGGKSKFEARDPSSFGATRSSTRITKRVVVADREESNRSFLSFFKRHFGGQKSGAHNIRVDSVEAEVEKPEIYADAGPYAAAQQLAALASSAATYREIEEAEGEAAARAHVIQQAKGRASFGARDPSPSQEDKVLDIARSPEEIRRKLEARRLAAEKAAQDDEGSAPRERARFVARDLDSDEPDK